MTNKLLVLFCSFLLLFQLEAIQAQGWEKYYPRNSTTEISYAIRPTADGGYLTAGYTSSPSNASIATLVKLNQRGEEQRRIYNTNPAFYNTIYYDLENTPDGGFIVGGMCQNIGSATVNGYLVKYNAAGAVVWEQVYADPSSGNTLIGLYDVDVTPDSGFIATGYYDGDCRTIKTDALGNIEWSRIYDYGASSQFGVAITALPNQSGYAVLTSEMVSPGNSFYKITRMDIQGDTIWTKDYPSDHSIIFEGDIILTDDGHFGIVGAYRLNINGSANRDMWVAKLDTANGNVVWQSFFGRSPNSDIGYSIVNTLDGGLVASGCSNNGNTSKLRLVKLNTNGTTVWDKEYGPWGDISTGRSVFALSDSSYVIAGYSGPNSTNNGGQMMALKVNDEGELYGSILSGQVYYDRDSSCLYNGNDLPLANRLIYAYKDSNTVFYGSTDSAGNYEIRIDTGRYRIGLVRHYSHVYFGSHGCVSDSIVTTIWYAGNNRSFDFPQVALISCSLVEVHMGTPFLRRCFSSDYSISFCNYGTQDAIDIDMEVVLDPYLVVDTANLPLPCTILPNNTFVFTVDTIAVGQCGSFTIPLFVDCDSTVIGQTHCSQVSITPDSTCVVPPWAGATIQLDATCTGDSIRVVLRNVGGPMNTPLNYLVYEDNIMLRNQSFLLGAGQSQNFQFEALTTGATYRIEAQQPTGFPALLGDSIVAQVIERCRTIGRLGLVTSLPNYDGSPFLDIDCRQNIGAYDPNDKRGFPSGVGAANYITKNNVLDYHLRFQNTGTDTAFTVVIIDTLDAALNLTTLQLGASSHPYSLQVYGQNHQIVAFTFNNIMLVDSNANESASHGFVQFTIDQQPNNPLGTVINNEAAIYFDFNAPIFTNTTLHTVGENFIQAVVTGVEDIEATPVAVTVLPNPFRDQATIRVDGLSGNTPLQLQVFNMMGQQVTTLQSTNHQFEVQRGRLEAGVYVFRIVEEGVVRATGKFIVR